ncbi:MAG: hypothetical protein HOP18_07685 [Deltaproteobacteria bacterium]|nr:hypothetical protein [Deltaproteobacteria bacterium]
MTCRDFIDFLESYTSGALSRKEQALFHLHLSLCPHCTKYLDSYQKTIRIGKAVLAPTDDTVPAEVPEDLIKAILAARPETA